MDNRFEKIAEFLAGRYVAMQESRENEQAAEQADEQAIDQAVEWVTGQTVKQADWLGEDPNRPSWNVPLTVAGGITGVLRNLPKDVMTELKNSPFTRLNDPELVKQLSNPYEKFMHGLLSQQEGVTGGAKQVGKFLTEFPNQIPRTRNPNSGNLNWLSRWFDNRAVRNSRMTKHEYINKLEGELKRLLEQAPGMKEQFKSLTTQVPDEFLAAAKKAVPGLQTLRNSVGFPLEQKIPLDKIMDSLKAAKTQPEIEGVGQKLRDFGNQLSKNKGVADYAIPTNQRRDISNLANSLFRENHYVPNAPNPTAYDDFGRALKKITNVPKKPLPLGSMARGGGAYALGAGVVLPQVLDWLVPSQARRTPAKNP